MLKATVNSRSFKLQLRGLVANAKRADLGRWSGLLANAKRDDLGRWSGLLANARRDFKARSFRSMLKLGLTRPWPQARRIIIVGMPLGPADSP